jgi:type II secretory pathway component PulJ
MSCCSGTGAEELEIETLSQIIMFIKDSNAATQWDSVQKAALLTLGLWSKEKTLDRTSREYLQRLTQDVLKRKERLEALKQQAGKWQRASSGLGEAGETVEVEPVEADTLQTVDALVNEVQKRQRFLENKLRKQQRHHRTV